VIKLFSNKSSSSCIELATKKNNTFFVSKKKQTSFLFIKNYIPVNRSLRTESTEADEILKSFILWLVQKENDDDKLVIIFALK